VPAASSRNADAAARRAALGPWRVVDFDVVRRNVDVESEAAGIGGLSPRVVRVLTVDAAGSPVLVEAS
jgi:hypothetical protein